MIEEGAIHVGCTERADLEGTAGRSGNGLLYLFFVYFLLKNYILTKMPAKGTQRNAEDDAEDKHLLQHMQGHASEVAGEDEPADDAESSPWWIVTPTELLATSDDEPVDGDADDYWASDDEDADIGILVSETRENMVFLTSLTHLLMPPELLCFQPADL